MSNYFNQLRQDWIQEMLDIYGFINREHLIKKFDISVPQASIDFDKFRRENPDSIKYNPSTKRYERKE